MKKTFDEFNEKISELNSRINTIDFRDKISYMVRAPSALPVEIYTKIQRISEAENNPPSLDDVSFIRHTYDKYIEEPMLKYEAEQMVRAFYLYEKKHLLGEDAYNLPRWFSRARKKFTREELDKMYEEEKDD